jgi:hypothetical protein
MIVRILKKIYRTGKYPLTFIQRKMREHANEKFVTEHVKNRQVGLEDFHFEQFRSNVLRFLKNMQTDNSGVRYRYAESVTTSTLYSSVYSCITLSLLGELKNLGIDEKQKWVDHFNSFQHEHDGLFYDPSVRNQYYDDSDWWGARHLALHMANVYVCLNARPGHPFHFLRKYYDHNYLRSWLDSNSDKFEGAMENDLDNKLMNVVCLLQYQRDTWKDQQAGDAVTFVQEYLLKKINPSTGLWGDHRITDPAIRSRKVQFAYHLFPFFFYDKKFDFDIPKIIDIVLNTQNTFGGYAPFANSSACEDIDSIDILIRLNELHPDSRIDESLSRSFRWVLANQMPDGGFVFRLNESFMYGHELLTSQANQGAVFPTWFRTLSLAYLSRYFNLRNGFTLVKCPGYEF